VQPGADAVLFVDQAGRRVTAKLNPQENMTLVPLPSKSPELNPVENIWQYMRDNWLSNRIFQSYDDIVDIASGAQQAAQKGFDLLAVGRDATLR
jgi:transposase